MAAQKDGQVDRQFIIQKIYTKDISFETPNSPAIFTQKWEPEINVELGTNGKPVSDGVHEVVLSVTVTAKIADKTAFLVEVKQAGVFAITGFPEQEMAAMVGSYCPNALFPYAREVISDLVTKGGFPQLLLAPVNFDALYAQHMEQVKKQSPAPAVH